VFAPAAYVLAALVAKSHASAGHPFAPTDPRAGAGALAGLAVHQISERGEVVAIPVEFPVGPERQLEGARAGTVVLGCRHNRDDVVVEHLRVAFREATPGETRSAGVELAEQLVVSRAVKLARLLVSSGAPGSERALVEAMLELFPNPPPVGPAVEVELGADAVHITVKPHRYWGVSLGEVAFSVPRSG
jgi:hypothetical protein